MKKFINYFRDDITKVSTLSVLTVGIISATLLIVGNTFAANSFEIVFNRAENTEVLKTCHTNEDGKLDEECVNAAKGWCDYWSLESWNGYNNQSNPISSSEFANMTFTKDENYYCVAKSSQDYYTGCYICKDDDSIMKWGPNGNADSKCSSGYKLDTSIKDEAKCPVVVPESCYVCKNDNNIMKWDNNGDSDNSCSSGYAPIDKGIDECKTIVPEDACYICKNDDSIMKWDNNGDSDNNCSLGYMKEDGLTQSQCKPKENISEAPVTGNILMFIIWVIGLASICYSVYYFKTLKVND